MLGERGVSLSGGQRQRVVSFTLFISLLDLIPLVDSVPYELFVQVSRSSRLRRCGSRSLGRHFLSSRWRD